MKSDCVTLFINRAKVKTRTNSVGVFINKRLHGQNLTSCEFDAHDNFELCVIQWHETKSFRKGHC